MASSPARRVGARHEEADRTAEKCLSSRKGVEVGRHSGAVCGACQQRILVRDGRLIQHQHVFPNLGKVVACVGSHSKAADGAAANVSPTSRVRVGLEFHRHPIVSRPQESAS